MKRCYSIWLVKYVFTLRLRWKLVLHRAKIHFYLRVLWTYFLHNMAYNCLIWCSNTADRPSIESFGRVSPFYIKKTLFWVDLIDYARYCLLCIPFEAMQCYISDTSFIFIVRSQIKHFYLSTKITTQYAHQMKESQEKD